MIYKNHCVVEIFWFQYNNMGMLLGNSNILDVSFRLILTNKMPQNMDKLSIREPLCMSFHVTSWTECRQSLKIHIYLTFFQCYECDLK